MTAVLEVRGMTKRYAGALANDRIQFSVRAGEIHALLGENGAGKSTLVKMVYGVVRPDGGEMRFNGAPFSPRNPADARSAGIGLVFQHFSLFEALSVAENIALGMRAADARRNLPQRIREVSAAYGLPLDPRRQVGELSVGERQRVEVVRCLLQSPKLLIMDEPTSVLTPQEAETLFGTLRSLARDGVSILYISHRLEEIRELCDAATVLRGGRVVATCDPSEKTASELARMMIGAEVPPRPGALPSYGDPLLEVAGLSLRSANPHGVDLHDIRFTVRSGEVLGVAGVAGNGQDELLLALSGETRCAADAVRVNGAAVGQLGPVQRREIGFCVAPEERIGHAAAPDMSLAENALITARSRLGLERRGILNRRGAARYAGSVLRDFDVRAMGVRDAARALSGGNLQKFLVGREINQRPLVFAVSQPTWGVDVGAAAAIRAGIRELASDGAAVLVISQDLDELLEISTSLAILADGRLSPARPPNEMPIEEIGLLMGGRAPGATAHD